jgi:hypothetical protein
MLTVGCISQTITVYCLGHTGLTSANQLLDQPAKQGPS